MYLEIQWRLIIIWYIRITIPLNLLSTMLDLSFKLIEIISQEVPVTDLLFLLAETGRGYEIINI